MKGQKQMPELPSCEVADHSREAIITELGFEELLPVSGGQACAGAHYDKVVLAMRKAGGDPG